jgi:malic enzyme
MVHDVRCILLAVASSLAFTAATGRVYFHLLMTRTEEVLPYIYTPTVGEACETYHELPLLTQVMKQRCCRTVC